MKRTCHISLFICATAAIVGTTSITNADGLLTAQSFPKTAADTSFIDRMINLAEGYDEFDTLYDSNGNCISGCAYNGIKLEDAISASKRATEAAYAKLREYQLTHPDITVPDDPTPSPGNDNNDDIVPPINTSIQPPAANTLPAIPFPQANPAPQITPPPTVDTPPANPTTPPAAPAPVQTAPSPNDNNNNSEYKCPTGKYSRYVPRGNALVNHAPIDTDLVITSDIGERSVSGGTPWHQGIDLRALDDTPIYMPANGIITFVGGGDSSSAGKYIWVYHPAEGIYTRYLHLNDISMVKKGDKIQGGCLFAKSGHSGRGKNGKPYKAHLHYEIKMSQTNNRPDVIDPFGNGINRLGRSYKFKSRDTMRGSRGGVPPIGCVGFLL